MTEPLITLIYPANVEQAWPFLYPILEPAVTLSGTHNMEDVRKSIMGGQAQLWVQWRDTFDAAVVTEFMNYPRGLWFRFWLAGAKKHVKVEWEKFFETLVDFAKKNNCAGIEDCGRSGWDHYCPTDVKKVGTVRRMSLTTGELMKAG